MYKKIISPWNQILEGPLLSNISQNVNFPILSGKSRNIIKHPFNTVVKDSHKNSTLHRLLAKSKGLPWERALEAGATLFYGLWFHTAIPFWARDQMSHMLRRPGDENKTSFLPSRIFQLRGRMAEKKKGKKKTKMRKDGDEKSTKCSQQKSEGSSSHTLSLGSPDHRCLGTAREVWEAVAQKLLFLGVSNGTEWAFGCLLHPSCQIPLLGHLDWQAFIWLPRSPFVWCPLLLPGISLQMSSP